MDKKQNYFSNFMILNLLHIKSALNSLSFVIVHQNTIVQ
jgi:hypothetical protein